MWAASSRTASRLGVSSPGPVSEWESAHSLYAAGRPDLAVQKLRDSVEKEPSLRERASVWRCLLLAGMSRAYLELGAMFQEGARQNGEQSALFRARGQAFQSLARQYSFELRELMETRDQWLQPADTVVLDFGMPGRGTDQSLALVSIARGRWPGDPQADAATQDSVMRAILEETMKVTGARSAAELGAQLSRGPLRVSKEKFLEALRGSMEWYTL